MMIGIEHLKDVKDQLTVGEGLLFRTGWHRFIDADDYRTALPWIGRELARGASRRRSGSSASSRPPWPS